MKNKRLFYKKFFKYILVSLLILVLALISTNIYLDKYGVFKNDLYKQKYWPNERALKIRHILNNPKKYDSFIFGSSRAELLNAKSINKGHFYNFTFPISTFYEELRYLKMFINKGIKIKNIILCIDNDSFKYDEYPYSPCFSKNQAHFLYYPETVLQKIKYYTTFLFINPLNQNDNKIKFYDFTKKAFFDSGSIAQSMDLKTYKRSTEKITKIYKTTSPYNPVNLKLLKEFSELCKQNNINLTVIIMPEHYKSYIENQLSRYNEYKEKIAEITPYYDFSGVNKMTTNDFNFYNYSHFDYNVACAILERLYGKNKFSAPSIEGFGDYVTNDNVDEHIKTLCSKTPEVKNCIPKTN